MIPEKLKLTDERLIELLRDRLTILTESGLPTFEEQISSVAPLLAQLGVPEFVWKNTMAMSCLAVLSARSSEKNVTPQKLP